MMEKPAVLVPIQISVGLSTLLTIPIKAYFSPEKYFTAFCTLSVSRFFHRSGRPSGVIFPEITAEVQASAGFDTPIISAKESARAQKVCFFIGFLYLVIYLFFLLGSSLPFPCSYGRGKDLSLSPAPGQEKRWG